MYHSGQDIGAVVGEIGSATTKIGLAGEDFPRLAHMLELGTIKHSKASQQC